MANLIIDDAITKVRQLLDDTSSTVPRWTATQVLDALADALNGCLVRYTGEGGDRFDLEHTATTSATTGSVSISSVLPLLVKQVSVVVGNLAYRIPTTDRMRRGYIDLTARDLRILYVREYALSATTTHPLVGVAGTEANSWRAFDKWICFEAALQLAAKDMELPRLQNLRDMTAQAAKDALARPSTPGSYETPRPEWSPLFGGVCWQMVQPSTLYLTRSR